MAQKVEPMDITEPVQVFVRPKFDRPSLLPPSSHVRDGYTIQPVEARHSALVYIRHRVFGVYKRLFSIVALGNLAALIYVACQYTNPTLSNAALLSTAISANLFVACLFRTEDFINLLYSSVVWVPLTLSLSIRRRLANIYEFGGIHSGTGVACTSWTLLFCIQITRAHLAGEPVGPGVLTVTFLILSLLLFMVAGAQPAFRSAQHNIFEATHRICGWGSLILYWPLTILLVSRIATSASQTFTTALSTTPTFYLLIATTVLIILPWLRLRRITLQATTPSSHVTRLHFPGSMTARPTQTVRISTSPLFEWHAFATIPPMDPEVSILPNTTHNHKPQPFTVLVSSAGDWTRSAIADPRSARQYWFRGIPTTGVTQVARLFRSVIVVATGSGIGPCLSLMAAVRESAPSSSPNNNGSSSTSSLFNSHGTLGPKCYLNRLIWSTQSPTKTYGEGVLREVHTADPDALVWDTSTRGRPDLVVLAAGLYNEVGAEAVVVVSNRNVTRKVVLGLKKRGIPAYGPIFDS